MSEEITRLKRPIFLTVLCVISFVFCTYGIWTYIGVAFGDRAVRILDQARVDAQTQLDAMGPEAANDPMSRSLMDGQLGVYEDMAEHSTATGILTILYLAITAFAIWLMWNLKKTGFWLFAGAQVPGFLIPFIWIKPTVVALVMFGFSGLLWAGLIVLFALNLKHMR